MIRREEARLRSLFHRLLLLSAAAVPVACSSAETSDATDASTSDSTLPNGNDGAAGADVGVPVDGGGGGDATVPGDSATAPDALDPFGFLDSACDPQYLDAAADGSDAMCAFYAVLPCGLPPNSLSEGCYLTTTQCGTLCNQVPTLARLCGVSECLVPDAATIPDAAPLTLECATGLSACGSGLGRRPEGLACSTPARSTDAIGATLAEMAHLEAASVHAFHRLERELAAMGAPRALVRQAARSARDEVRHARVTTRLARRRGAKPAPVVIDRRPRARSVAAFALENAVEGCVRECFGALVATRQASRAQDPQIAQAMSRIAVDETRHAALAWEIARWLEPQLGANERETVTRAMRGAIASLRCEAAAVPADVATALGLPTGEEARRLVDAFGAACLASVAPSAESTHTA